MDPIEQPDKGPASLSQSDTIRRAYEIEARKIINDTLQGTPQEYYKYQATEKQAEALLAAAEAHGIDRAELKKAFSMTDGTLGKITQRFLWFYTKTKSAEAANTPKLNIAPTAAKAEDRYTNAQASALLQLIRETKGNEKFIEFSNLIRATDNEASTIDEWLKANGLEAQIIPKNRRRAYNNPQGRPRLYYSKDQAQEITAKILELTRDTDAEGEKAIEFMGLCTESKFNIAKLNEWLHANGLSAAIPGNTPSPKAEDMPTAEAEAEAEPIPTDPNTPEQEPEPAPAETETKAETAPAPIPPKHLQDHIDKLNEHIAGLIDGQERAAFYEEIAKIKKQHADDLEAQDAEILALSVKVKAAEDRQNAPPETEALIIRDGDQITDGSTGETITGPQAEAARQELDTAAAARKKIRQNKIIPPPALRTEPARDFKNRIIEDDNGNKINNPVYISTDPQDARYISNTLNNTDLAERIAAELKGYILNDTQPTPKGTKGPAPYWRVWNNTAYRHDPALFKQAIIYAINTLYNEASHISNAGIDAKVLTSLLKFTNNSKNDKNITSTLNCLKDVIGVSMDFNTVGSQDLLCLDNIIFNSATGEIIKATDTARINEIKKLLPYHTIHGAYDPTAEPVEYLKMVYTFFYDNTTPGLSGVERQRRAREGMAWYLRYRGYVMFSGNPEGVNLFLIGPPHNGKTTLARASGGPLHDEYDELTTVSEIYASHTGPLESYIKMAPKRECLIDEGAGGEEKGQRLSGNFFKNTTTARRIRGRGIYQHDALIPHNLKRTFSMNEPPHFDTIDGGTLRRMVVPPCNHHYTEDEKIPDYDLYLIEKEGDAILSLMINECIKYIKGDPTAPEGSPERRPGLLPIPEHWKQYKADVLGGTIYTLFLLENYEPITNAAEKTKDTRVYKTDLIKELIQYAKDNGCIDDLGQLAISNEVTIRQGFNGEYETQEKTLNKNAIKQLNVALLELGYGQFTNAHDTPRAYINARKLKDTKTNWN